MPSAFAFCSNAIVLQQQTLNRSAGFSGIGLHSGNRVNMTFLPAPANHGVRFRRVDLERVLALLPALQRPTISSLSEGEWVAVNTIIEERTVRDLIPKLKAAGGQGIVEYPLNKIVV